MAVEEERSEHVYAYECFEHLTDCRSNDMIFEGNEAASQRSNNLVLEADRAVTKVLRMSDECDDRGVPTDRPV